MLNSKQRASLRKLANKMETILYVGKGGISENVLEQTDEALLARELIKGKVQESSPLTSKEVAEKLAGSTGADVVQVIGSRFVLYRPHPKEPKIRV